ncbi:DUF3187 domain-containing protein [Sulfurimonas sp. SAG-AH-194-L11]|nr:DUF3187 domain-containing protein [Sulfurimonas sp. SAG-AH-194-L11]MDF1876300.1 DUF3187 domain-containing protein [Sulfurimonas sp. SAG-AH-194-L11]
MKKIVSIVLVLATSSLFAYVDTDFDGVEDGMDLCPNTSFTELVDIKGCPIKSLVSPHKFDIIVGASYSDINYQSASQTQTLSSTVQFDYYYKNFSLSASTSYFNTSSDTYLDAGLNDSFVGASYTIKPTNSLYIRLNAGVILPTYETTLNNNETDYTGSVSLSYTVAGVSLFGGYSYTFINDLDTTVTDANGTTTISYQNAEAYNVGIGKSITDKLYMSVSYNSADSVYENLKDIETASLYGYYGIDTHWFTTFSYARGLSDTASDNYASIRLGYIF